MTRPDPQIRKGRKYDQVLQGARTVFLEDGYEGASVDDIARAAGVSKATLYSYFPGKEALFMQVASDECRRQADMAVVSIDRTGPAEEVLGAAARHAIAFILSDLGQNIYRICVAESARFPELGRMFYETGPAMAQAMLQEYLAEATERGELAIEHHELELAASQFVELCHAVLFKRCLFFVQTDVSDADVAKVSEGAVRTFLARYAA